MAICHPLQNVKFTILVEPADTDADAVLVTPKAVTDTVYLPIGI